MTKKINISRVVLPADIPAEVTFAVVSDLHDREGEEVAQLVHSLSPDAVLLPGDLFETPPRRSYYRFEEACKLLRALSPLPIFYAPGNHDYRLPEEVDACMTACGVTKLLNTSCDWHGVKLGGIPSAQYAGKVPNTDFLEQFAKEDGFKLLLCHHPEYFRHIHPLAIDLTVSGHAHGGQWCFFGHGVYSPGQGLFPRYTAGLYEGRLLVSRGLKISTPIPRIFNPREIILLTLKPRS